MDSMLMLAYVDPDGLALRPLHHEAQMQGDPLSLQRVSVCIST